MTKPLTGLEIVGQLLEFAEHALAQRMKQENPNISPEEIRAGIARWYMERPGSELGDCSGPVQSRKVE